MSVFAFTYARWPKSTDTVPVPLRRVYVRADSPSAAWRLFEALYPFTYYLAISMRTHD